MATIQEPPVVDDGGFALPAAAPLRSGQLDLHLPASIATGRRRGDYRVVVTNTGTSAVEATLSAYAPGERLRAAVYPSALVLAPGEQRLAEIVLRPCRPRLLGGELDHTATIQAHAAAGGAVSRNVVFVQERLVPFGGWLLLIALVAAAAFGATRMPAGAVAVPNVTGATDTASAERALRDAGLRLDPALRSRTVARATPGTILDQMPASGTRVRRGDRVTLLVVVAAQRSVTPALDGMTAARAAGVLRAAGLSAGPLLPDGAGANAVVASQLPVAGQRVPAGTAVTVFTRAGAAGASAAGGAPAAGGQDIEIPALGGRDVRAYARAVAVAGLVPRVIRAIDPAPAGTLVEVRPRPGTALRAGDRVRLLVAAGVPQLALDTGAVVQLFDPRGARTVREASPPQGTAVEPSWSADGRRLLYRVGRRLMLVSARLADSGRVLYSGAEKYAAATFAPSMAAGVIALVRRTGSDGDLCFATVGDAELRPRCVADRRWDLGRQISWRPGGRELLVFGVRRGHPGRFGILRYRTSAPFSADPRDWHGALATDAARPGRGVIAASYAPNGEDVALVTNVGLPRFQLLVTRAGELRDPSARALPVRACEVAWRPDGGELAVVQSDDACGRPLGQIVRVDPRAPRRTVTVSSGGRHPAYQPLTYSGPKGVS
jgi:beta-lactam-binding protein with PASTA domain